MEGEIDDGHLDQVDESNDQPMALKKLEKVDNPDDPETPEEIDIEDQNPFHIQVILDVLFKRLSFEEVKKFRIVSSTWNQMGISELSKRHQQTITFYDHFMTDFMNEERSEDKLDKLIQLKKGYKEVFPASDNDYHQDKLFSKFSFFDTNLLNSSQMDQFFEHFSPKYIQLVGHGYSINSVSESEVAQYTQVEQNMCKFLVKVSSTVQEISFYANFRFYTGNPGCEENVLKLISTAFPNLRKISYDSCTSSLRRMFFYPIIGQNSPKLQHLIWYSSACKVEVESPEEVKEMVEPTGLMSKLKILNIHQLDTDLLKGITLFGGVNGVLKLTQLRFANNNSEVRIEPLTRLIESQAESLKILELLLWKSRLEDPNPRIRVQFPTLKNLTHLQINNFAYFETCYEPLDFSIQFPKLEDFKTFFNIRRFLGKNLGQCGDSVKSVKLFKSRYPFNNPEDVKYNDKEDDRAGYKMDFVKFGGIFPNLEFLELGFDSIPLPSWGIENLPFWSHVKKVVVHCQLKELLLFRFKRSILNVIKKLYIVVECEDNVMDEDSYKSYLGGITKGLSGEKVLRHLYYYNRERFYKKFLTTISNDFKSVQVISIRIIGYKYKISEDFMRDFRAIFPQIEFVCGR